VMGSRVQSVIWGEPEYDVVSEGHRIACATRAADSTAGTPNLIVTNSANRNSRITRHGWGIAGIGSPELRVRN